ncbi:MAG: penicillin-insensitive murein endopeptidase [Azoarcus sp.]|jgi:penicillin-insensitive murein endopeptidase|nr:penicillin-insensitive murein endopeptidase [Azoarcus sp.]
MKIFATAIIVILSTSAMGAESVCYGTPSNGRLEAGVQLPGSGVNFEPYSSLGVAAGRTYVHSAVADVVLIAYSSLARSMPEVKYVYGESGWKEGGRIRPHRTHQNGLAVDFMVPVRDAQGKSVALPSGAWNKFGYDIEFDSEARFGGLTIDFDAIAEHLHALHSAAQAKGIGVERVIFDPGFLPELYKTKRGDFIKNNINFMKGQAWIRHDEHYHVDFSVPCKPKKN